MIIKVISGGQTGADQGGIIAARERKVETGGWAPRGWRTDAGPAPWLADLGLREASSTGYPARTRLNVEHSHATLVFGNADSPGCRLTTRLCFSVGRPVLHVPWRPGLDVPDVAEAVRWAKHHRVETLNVAGNREASMPGIYVATYAFVWNLLDVRLWSS